MAKVEFNVVALGDFSSVNAQIKAFQVEVASLQKGMAGVGLNSALTKDLASLNNQFKQTLLSTGQFTATTVKMSNETQKFGEQLVAGKLKLNEYYNIIKMRSSESVTQMKALAVEQTKLQNSIVMSDPSKKGQLSVFTPTEINKVANATKILANEQNLYNIAVAKGSQQLINWGKNTQWAGRQLTVGMSVPIMLFGQQATQVFKDVNDQLVRLQKVYGTGLTQPTKQALDSIKSGVIGLSRELAASMGIAAKDTAQMAADLAATGKTGNDLLGATREAMRLQKLGEMDTQSAMQTTISLQNVYKLSTNELSGAVDFLNAVENQTSTSLQDLAAGIPKVGPIVQQLGGSFKDTAIMMVAMKEAGVPAAQSANAIKSALASLINPTKAAKDAFAAYNINLAGIATSTKGNPVQMIMQLQAALKGLAPLAQAQLIEKLFGKFQEARIQALITNLGAANSQTKTAFDLMNANSSQLAAVAANEMKTATESVTGKYQRAIETFKADLIPVGQKLMEIATGLLNFGNAVAKVFGGLPGPLKSLAAAIAIGVALSGPIIMLTGLMANFVGFLVKGIFNIKQLATGGKTLGQLLTPELIAAQNAAKVFDSGILKDVAAVDLLNKAIQDLTISMQGMNASLNMGTGVGRVVGSATERARTYKQMGIPGFSGGNGKLDSELVAVAQGEAIIDAGTTKKVSSGESVLASRLASSRGVEGYSPGGTPQYRAIGSNFAMQETIRKNQEFAAAQAQFSSLESLLSSRFGNRKSVKEDLNPTVRKIRPQDMSAEEKAAYESWRQEFTTGFVKQLRASNPGLSNAEITKKLEKAYANLEVPIEQLPPIVQRVANRRIQQLNSLEKNLNNKVLTNTITARGIVNQGFLEKEYSTEFAHVGRGKTVKAGDVDLNTISDAKMRSDIEKIRSVDPNRDINFKGGLGFNQAGFMNNIMGQGKAVDTKTFASQWQKGGMDKWQTAFSNVGLKLQELPADIQKEIEIWDKETVSRISKLPVVTDESVAKIEAEVRAEMATSGNKMKEAAAALLTQIDNTITEARYSVAKGEGAAFKVAGLTDVTEGHTSRAGISGSAAYRGVPMGAGVIANPQNIAVMETEGGKLATGILDGMKRRLKIKSPSQAGAEEIGVPLIQGVQQGVQEALPGMEAFVETSMLKAGTMAGDTYSATTAKAITSTTPEVLNAVNLQEEEIIATQSKWRGKLGKMGGLGIGMGAMMGGSMLAGKGGALGAVGSVASTVGTASMFTSFMGPGATALGMTQPEILAAVAAIALAYKGVGALIAEEKKQTAQSKATFTASSDVAKFFGSTLADTSSHLDTITTSYDRLAAASRTLGSNMSVTNAQLDSFNKMVKGLPKDNELSLIMDKIKSTTDSGAIASMAQSFVNMQIAIGSIDPAKATQLLNLMLAGSGHSGMIGSIGVAGSQQDAITAAVKSAKSGAGVQQSGIWGRLLKDTLEGGILGELNRSRGKNKQVQDNINQTINQLVNAAINSKSLSQIKTTMDGLAAAGYAGAKGINAFKVSLTSAADQRKVEVLQKMGLTLSQIAAVFAYLEAGQSLDLTKGLSTAKMKEIESFLKTYKAPTAANSSVVASLNNVNSGLTKQSDALKAQIKALETKKKIIDKELKTQQDITSEMQRQHDYQNAQTDLATQQKNALEHGDYLQAAQLGQDKRFGTMQFAQQGKVSALQAKSDNLGQQIADLQDKQTILTDAINKNTDAVNKATDTYVAPVTTKGDIKLPMTGANGANTTSSLTQAYKNDPKLKPKLGGILNPGIDPSKWNQPGLGGLLGPASARSQVKQYAKDMGYNYVKGKQTEFEIDHNGVAYKFLVLADGNIEMLSAVKKGEVWDPKKHKSVPVKPSLNLPKGLSSYAFPSIMPSVGASSVTAGANSTINSVNITVNGNSANATDVANQVFDKVKSHLNVQGAKKNVTNKVVHKP